MNVEICAQILSYSVARSMELLQNSGDSLFLDSGGTISFIKNFNKAFNIFNSKHTNSNNLFKKSLTEQNAEKIFNVFYHIYKIIEFGWSKYFKNFTKYGISWFFSLYIYN